MFCTDCGHKLDGQEEFCPECGHKNEQIKKQDTFSEQLIKNNPLKPLLEKIKKFFTNVKLFVLKHKKLSISVCSIFICTIISIILFNKFYDFTKISWDLKNGDANLEYTTSHSLNYKVNAYDKHGKEIKNIEFKVSKGKVVTVDNEARWDLSSVEKGKYTITAIAPSGKKIEKQITILQEENNEPLSIPLENEFDENEDIDHDGLTNKEEKNLGTNIYKIDTDDDGISDYYEVKKSKTDPLKKDTDNDSIKDGDEIALGLDPLKIDSKGDNINDAKRTLSYNIKESDVTMKITGTTNIASSSIDVFQNTTFEDMDGILGKIYNFSTEGKLEKAEVNIKYNMEELKKKNIDENNLTLYYFNEKTNQLEPIVSKVDKSKKILTATLTHFSKYILGDKNVVLKEYKNQVLFVIDNSISMYSQNQIYDAGYDSCTGCDGNDYEFKRLSLTNKLIGMFNNNYEYGISEFAGSYKNLHSFSNNRKEAIKAVNSMKSTWHVNTDGTNIKDALNSGINEFESNNNNKYIVLLTDGNDTTSSFNSNKDIIINNALEKEVKVCVIGLGENVDTDVLTEIAQKTGCAYYNASDASALSDIYDKIGAEINYNYLDTDDDGKADSMVIADTNFLPARDGFNFENFSSDKSLGGHCYGMAAFANLYYKDQLPIKLKKESNLFFSSNGYDLTNTFIERKENLYDYKITNKPLSYYLYDKPSDYRDRVEVVDGKKTVLIKKEYYDQLKQIGVTFSNKKDEYNWFKDIGANYYQSALLTIDNDTFNNHVKKDESQLLNAIWRLFIEQKEINNMFDYISGSDEFWEDVISAMEQDDPAIFVIRYTLDGESYGHAINVIGLSQDINDPNKFKLKVYDNNYPGETRYIEVYRTKLTIEGEKDLFNKYQYYGIYYNDKTPFILDSMGIVLDLNL